MNRQQLVETLSHQERNPAPVSISFKASLPANIRAPAAGATESGMEGWSCSCGHGLTHRMPRKEKDTSLERALGLNRNAYVQKRSVGSSNGDGSGGVQSVASTAADDSIIRLEISGEDGQDPFLDPD